VSHYTHQIREEKKTESLKMFQVKLISTKRDEKGANGKLNWGENNGQVADKTAFHLDGRKHNNSGEIGQEPIRMEQIQTNDNTQEIVTKKRVEELL